MKKLFFAIAAIASAAILFTSCNEKKPEIPKLAEAISGTYAVNAVVTIGSADPMPMTAELKVTKLSNTAAKVEIGGFKLAENPYPIKASIAIVPLEGSLSKITVDYTGKISYSQDGEKFIEADATMDGDFNIIYIDTKATENTQPAYKLALEVDITIDGEDGAEDTVINVVIDNEAPAEVN